MFLERLKKAFPRVNAVVAPQRALTEPDSAPTTRSFSPDLFLLTVVLLILTIGIVMVTSAGYIIAAAKHGDGFYFTKKQGFAMLIGLGIMYLFSLVNPNFWKKAAVPLMGVGVVFLLLVFIPGIGAEMGGSHRWVRMPLGFFLQPSEFIKYALVIFIATSLAKKGDGIRDFAVGFLPHVLVMVAVAFIILMQPDFGTAVILTLVGFLMLFVAGVRISHLFGCMALCLPFVVYVATAAPYRVARIVAFLNPWSDPGGTGYHIIHSQIAFGCGGFWGVGIGKGIQKLYYLPQPHSDFIFAIVGEELGLLGVLGLISLFFLLIFKGLRVAIRNSDPFQRYLAFGITSLIGLQAMVNMAVAMGLLPTKGLPLPLVSLGGTSLVMNLAGLGILMAIAKTAQMTPRKEKP